MTRRFTTIAVASAVCGMVLVGPVAAQGIGRTAAEATQTPTATEIDRGQLPEPLIISVEYVNPQLTRIHLSMGGVDKGILESTAFTLTTGPGGVTVASSDKVMVVTSHQSVSVGNIKLTIGPGGTSFEATTLGPTKQ